MADTTNVFGPRPRDAGFRCMHCGTEEYPLFGVALAPPRKRAFRQTRKSFLASREGWEPESNTYTSCFPCLGKCDLLGTSIYPSKDTRSFLERHFWSKRRHAGNAQGHPNG